MYFLFLIFLQSWAQIQTVHLPLGEETKVPLSSTKVWIEDSKVLRAESAGNQLRITGVKDGPSQVIVGDKKYQFYVVNPKKQNALEALRPLIEKTLGLEIHLVQGESLITGELFRMDDWIKIAKSVENQEVEFQMSARINTETAVNAQKYFDFLFEKSKLPRAHLIFSKKVELRLSSKDPYFSAYRKLLSPYGVTISEDHQSLRPEPSIRIQITVAEVQRQLTQKIGLRWPDAYRAQILSPGVWDFSSSEAVAHFFEQSGQGRVLASPNLISKSGKEAEFLAGGEFPIKVTRFRDQNVIWKKYGIMLKVKPEADAQGQMNIQINTEISSIDPSKAIDGVPGLITHRVSSQFDLSRPQTIALSGLIRNEDSESKDGMPWLSRIPVLGALFSSKDFKENRTELVIFVRPEIIDLSGAEEAPANHLREKAL